MSQQTRPFIQEQRNLIAKDHALFREMMKGIELRNTEFFNKMNTMETGQMTLPMKKWSCGISALPGGSTVPTFIIVEEAMQLISERMPSEVPALTGFF